MSCRFPFMCDTATCDRCAVPVIVIPPEIEPLKTKLAMLCFVGAMFSIIAVAAFTLPHNFNSVVTAHAEDAR
jgi:hypothetical protein